VATEDLATALRDGGAVTSIDIDLVAQTGRWLRELLGRPAPAAGAERKAEPR
jgi:hypothetical protein